MFLVLQNVKYLPGIGQVQGKKLEALVINYYAGLKKMEFGISSEVIQLFNYCCGKDDREIEVHHERKSVSAEINYGMQLTKASGRYYFV